MKTCTSCGNANLDRARFCEQCGAKLADLQPVVPAPPPEPPTEADLERERAEQRHRAASGLPPSWMPPPVQPSFAQDPDWKWNDSDEEPPKKKRRKLLWVVGIALLACILVCVGASLFLEFTGPGKRWVSSIETQIAESGTEEAGSSLLGTPAP